MRGAGARHVRPLGRVFAHFRAFAFREKKECPPLLQNERSSKSLRLLVAKDESFAFGSASSVGRPGQPSPSDSVDGFDDSTVHRQGKESEGKRGQPSARSSNSLQQTGMVQ